MCYGVTRASILTIIVLNDRIWQAAWERPRQLFFVEVRDLVERLVDPSFVRRCLHRGVRLEQEGDVELDRPGHRDNPAVLRLEHGCVRSVRLVGCDHCACRNGISCL